MNKLHERALRIVCDDYNSKLEEFLTKDDSFTMHHQNIQTLAIEMFKFHNGFSKVPFWIFRFISENNYSAIETRSIKTFYIFRAEVRKCKPTNCSCRLCKT